MTLKKYRGNSQKEKYHRLTSADIATYVCRNFLGYRVDYTGRYNAGAERLRRHHTEVCATHVTVSVTKALRNGSSTTSQYTLPCAGYFYAACII